MLFEIMKVAPVDTFFLLREKWLRSLGIFWNGPILSKMISKWKIPDFLMHLNYRKLECPDLFDGVDENMLVVESMTISTDETMADLVESAIVPHIVKYEGGPDGKQGSFHS